MASVIEILPRGTRRNIWYLSETHFKPKFRDISFTHNFCSSYPIVLKLCTEYGSSIEILCAKLQNDLATEMHVMDERDFVRFEFKMSFGRIIYIAQSHRLRD